MVGSHGMVHPWSAWERENILPRPSCTRWYVPVPIVHMVARLVGRDPHKVEFQWQLSIPLHLSSVRVSAIIKDGPALQ